MSFPVRALAHVAWSEHSSRQHGNRVANVCHVLAAFAIVTSLTGGCDVKQPQTSRTRALWSSVDDVSRAIREGRDSVVSSYLQSGGDPNALDSSGTPLLHRAVYYAYARPSIAQSLLAAGCDVNLLDSNGQPAISLARDAATLTLLIDNGADLEQDGRSAMQRAIRDGRTFSVELLVDRGVQVDLQMVSQARSHYEKQLDEAERMTWRASDMGDIERAKIKLARAESYKIIIDMLEAAMR
ncbi:MAG: ankyrin repeat domain-containing protein [Planctomycetes bacterium]|nr:ankyrin repeat domain-containing protein [Planctomycetota bacterium]